MCTVVVRWSPEQPLQILALRDELTTREFDDPDRWWPDLPDVVGGRDRTAGGTWCASSVRTGATALVVNRPQKRDADPGAPSRGVLPLLAAEHDRGWLDRLDPLGMASFALLLATPEHVTSWDFDGTQVSVTEHRPGTLMLTSGGPEDGRADRYLPAFTQARFPEGWRRLVQQDPRDDPAALVVRHERDGLVFGTVFGQLIEALPGRLRLEHSRRPWSDDAWDSVTVLRRDRPAGCG